MWVLSKTNTFYKIQTFYVVFYVKHGLGTLKDAFLKSKAVYLNIEVLYLSFIVFYKVVQLNDKIWADI